MRMLPVQHLIPPGMPDVVYPTASNHAHEHDASSSAGYWAMDNYGLELAYDNGGGEEAELEGTVGGGGGADMDTSSSTSTWAGLHSSLPLSHSHSHLHSHIPAPSHPHSYFSHAQAQVQSQPLSHLQQERQQFPFESSSSSSWSAPHPHSQTHTQMDDSSQGGYGSMDVGYDDGAMQDVDDTVAGYSHNSHSGYSAYNEINYSVRLFNQHISRYLLYI